MPKYKIADATKIRHTNRAAILDLIRSQEPISRTRIADRLGISLSTVLRIVEELLDEGLVIPHALKERGGGRPGELLSFNGNAYAIIGIDLGYPNMLGTVANLAGEIYCQHSSPIQRYDSQENINRLLKLIGQLVNVPEASGKTIKGIGIGISGSVNHGGKMVISSPDLGWNNLPLAEIITRQFQLPVLLDTDINLITLGEYGFGTGRDASSLVCLTLGSSVLSGIILDGELLRGFTNPIGLLGFTFPGIDFLQNPNPDMGALESQIGGNGVTLKARRALESRGLLSQYPDLDPTTVYLAAQREESWAAPIIEDLITYLALAVANIEMLLGPEMIVITGKMASAAEFLPSPVTQRLAGRIPHIPNLVVSPLGTRSTVMGAIMLIYKGVLRSQAA